jgi:serine phosphatase RsbU (regulator of sigma subunit)
VLAGGCCVLALGALPTAQAAKNTTTTDSATPVETAVAPHAKHAERVAQSEAPVPPPVVSPPPAAPAEAPGPAHAKHGRVLPPPPPAGAPSVSGPPVRRLDREAPKPRAHRHQEGALAGEATEVQGSSQSAAPASGESTQGAEALARKEKAKKEKVKKEKAHKEKGKKEKPAEESEGSSSTPVLTPGKSKGRQEAEGSSSGEPAATAASLAISGPAPAGGTGEASTASFTPSAGGVGVHALRSAQRVSRKPVKKPGGVTRAATAATPVATTLLAASGAGAAKPSAPAHASAKRTHAAAAQPAIVKTFTRIVGVVPTPVRILIAALIALALALAIRSRLSGVRTRRLMRQRGQLLEDVGLLQAALLPVPPARLGPVGTSVAYRPADGPGAGGDFYDVFGLEDGRLAVIVGDVSGHGREALPHTALVRFTVRAYLEAGLSPRKALQTAGNVLDRQLAGSFATVVAAIYHPRERTLTYASAGHPPPVVLGDDAGADGTVASQAIELTTACSAPPLGAGMRTGTRETVISIPGPARLCFHTDGVTEARVGEDLFGAERLTVALTDLGRPASATALLDSVAERTDARPDDMAACLLRVEDGSGSPSIAHELLELDAATLASGRAEQFLHESGMSAAAAATAIDTARAELDRRDSVLLELSLGGGSPVAALEHDNVVHTAALAAVSAS